MKVGVLTFHWADNPGAVLQAYALCKVVENLGHDAEIIDYDPAWRGHRMPLLRWRNLRDGKFPCALMRKTAYARFRSKSLRLSATRSETRDQLRAMAASYDAIIVGSDQVWNPKIIKGESSYFLDFAAGSGCKLIAYAASLGVDTLPPEFDASVRNHLDRFDAISVRESHAATMISGFLGKPVEHVADPTLLLTDFDQLPDRNAGPSGHMLAYMVFPEALVAAARLRSALGMKMVHVGSGIAQGWSTPHLGYTQHCVDPVEWMHLIRRAGFVFTSSFHGTVFSILNRVPFVACARGDHNSRVESLLGLCGLGDRLVLPERMDAAEALVKAEVDWARVHAAISSERERSIAFLRGALAGYEHGT